MVVAVVDVTVVVAVVVVVEGVTVVIVVTEVAVVVVVVAAVVAVVAVELDDVELVVQEPHITLQTSRYSGPKSVCAHTPTPNKAHA